MNRFKRSSIAMALTAFVVLGAGGSALAAWFTSGSGAGLAAALTMPTGPTPTAQQIGTNVVVRWEQVAVDSMPLGERDDSGYVVTRHDADGDHVGGCSGVIDGSDDLLACTETDVPEGTWSYSVTPALSLWRGGRSAAATLFVDRTGPVVTLTAPAPATTTAERRPLFSGAAGNAVSDASTVQLKVYGGTAVAGVPILDEAVDRDAAAWQYTPSADLAAGPYVATVTQRDDFGNTTTAGPSTFTVATDTTRPTGSIAFPTTNWLNAESYRAGCDTLSSDICGTASDDQGLQKVEVSVRRSSDGRYWDGSAFTATTEQFGVATGTDQWSYSLSALLLTDGEYAVRARAMDTSGNAASPLAAAVLRYDNTKPTGTMTTPAASANVRGDVDLVATATDATSGVASVMFESRPSSSTGSWTSIGTDTTAPYSAIWDTSGLGAGSAHDVRVVTVDAAGNSATSPSRTVKVIARGKAESVTLLNGNNNADLGRVTNKDMIAISFSESVSLDSICKGWTGAAVSHESVFATISPSDTVSIAVSTTVCGDGQLNLGTVDLGADYITGTANAVFGGGNNPNTRTGFSWNSTTRTLTINLGERNGGALAATVGANHSATFHPSPAITTADSVGIDSTSVTGPVSRF